MTIAENTEVQTFGAVLTSPLESADERQDIRQVRLLMAAVLDRVHMTMGHTGDNQLGQNLLGAAIPQLLTTTDFVCRALAFCDEVDIDKEAAAETEASEETSQAEQTAEAEKTEE